MTTANAIFFGLLLLAISVYLGFAGLSGLLAQMFNNIVEAATSESEEDNETPE